MSKNPSLSDAVHSAAQPEPTPRAPGATKSLILRLPAELHRDLRQLALDTDTSLQALGVEGLERLLAERRP